VVPVSQGQEDAVTLADIEAARARIEGHVRPTPLLASGALSEAVGVPVYLKCENLQRTGSFKVRGAHNMLAVRKPSAVVTASAGNHAQGVALACRERGVAATVVMPRTAPLAKQLATRGYGAEVVLVEGGLAEAIEQARALGEAHGWLFVPPFDAPEVVAGQGTLGLELLEELPELATVLVPTGGGGLLAGVAVAVKSSRPDVRVVGVQTAAMPGLLASREARAPVAVERTRTIADGAAVVGPSALTHALVERYVDDLIEVPEADIASAVVFLLERARLVVEGAGALGVAALRAGLVRPSGPTVAIISGGNIDVSLLGRLVQRGLAVDGRQRRLTIAVANVPGELAGITAVCSAQSANIIEVSHDLAPPELPVGVARTTLRLEIAGVEAYEALFAAFLEAGFARGTATDLLTPVAAELHF
jgi:threonine dehydratase